MLDINRILQNPDELIESLKKRGVNASDIETKIKDVAAKQKKLKHEALGCRVGKMVVITCSS